VNNAYTSGDAAAVSLTVTSTNANVAPWAGSPAIYPDQGYLQFYYGANRTTAVYDAAFNPTGSGTPLDVGTYTYTITGLTGPKARDYYLGGGSKTGTVTITPATLSYSVLQDEYYGQQKAVQLTTQSGVVVDDAGFAHEVSDSVCCAMAPDTRPLYSITSNTFGAAVGLNLNFVDASGVTHIYTPTLEGGTYAVNATLTGAQAFDFVLATTPVSFTVHPAIITYQISGGEDYAQGSGFIGGGSAPTATLTGVVGSDKVGLVIGVFQGENTADRDGADLVSVNTAAVGNYHYQAVGLVADPNNYVLGPPSIYFDSGSLVNIVPAAPTVNSSASLATYVAQGVTVYGASDGTAAATSSSSLPATVLTSVSASTGVSQSASTSTTFGSATATGQANVSSSATAQAGLANTSAGATAGGAATLTVSYGPGYTAVGADTYGAATGTVALISKSPNISGDASLEAQAYVTTGVAGSLGAAGTGSASATGSVGATATADGSLGLKGGTITASGGAFVGAGASGSVQGQISGSSGTVGAGVTGYAGAVGVQVDPSVGYSNGQVTVSASISVGVGPVGVNINVNIGVNVGVAVDAAHTAVDTVGDALGFGSGPSLPDFNTAVRTITANPFSNPTAYNKALSSIVNNNAYGKYSNITAGDFYTLNIILSAQTDYTTEVTQTIPALQAQTAKLSAKLQANPASFTASDVQALQAAQSQEAQAMTQLKSDVSTMTNGADHAVVTPLGIYIVPNAAAAPAKTTTNAASSSFFGTGG
jgi:hypothetical protein